jgi:predicted PurR-regulated permease PerM
LASAVVVVAGLRAFGGVAGPVFLGLVLILAVTPMVSALRRRGLPGGLGVVVTVAAVYAILLAFVGALGYAVAELAGLLPTYAGRLDALLSGASAALATVGVDPTQIGRALSQVDLGSVAGFLQGLLGQLTFLQPRFVGGAVGLSITATFLSLVFWGWVLGALGALLAIPLTLLVKSLLVDIDPRTRWIDAFLADRPPRSAP